jgi:methylglutaconyl-CoA hydratase
MPNPGSGPTIDPGHVRVEIAQGVATVAFGHPRSNSMPGTLLTKLAATIAEAGQNPDVRVVILRSDGTGAFCAGASFDELQAIGSLEDGNRFFAGFAKVILAMIRCPKFVVARVHGRAAGGGVGLIAAADYAVAAAGASVKLSELAVGIGPFVVGPVIERKIGLGAYAAMSVDADWRTTEWAAQHGLYAEVRESVPAMDEALTTRVAWLERRNPAAMAQLKKVFWQGTEGWDTLLAERAAMSGSLILTPAARAAVAAAGAR